MAIYCGSRATIFDKSKGVAGSLLHQEVLPPHHNRETWLGKNSTARSFVPRLWDVSRAAAIGYYPNEFPIVVVLSSCVGTTLWVCSVKLVQDALTESQRMKTTRKSGY